MEFDQPEFDDFDDDETYSSPPHADDRLWRHPSEMAAMSTSPVNANPTATPWGDPPSSQLSRWRWVFAAAGVSAAICAYGALQLLSVHTASQDNTDVNTVLATSVVTGQIDNAANSQIAPTLAQPTQERAWPSVLHARVQPVMPQVIAVRGMSDSSGYSIVLDDGVLLTSAALVDGADSIVVWTDRRERYVGTLVGVDWFTDVAVVRFDGHGLPIADLGAADPLRLGQAGLAVSAGETGDLVIGSVIDVATPGTGVTGQALHGSVRVDLPVDQLMPGSPIFDQGGVVLAMVPTQAPGEAVGAVISIDVAQRIGHQLLAHGHVTRPWLGVVAKDLAPEVGLIAAGLNNGQGSMIEVTEIFANAPADVAGIQPGDVITSVGGRTVANTAELILRVSELTIGETVEVGLIRDQQRTVVLLDVQAVS